MHGNVPGQELVALDQYYPARDLPVFNIQEENDSIAWCFGPTRKRSVANEFLNDHLESASVQSRQKAKTDKNDYHAKTPSQLACPFQKQDSFKHHECLKYDLTSHQGRQAARVQAPQAA